MCGKGHAYGMQKNIRIFIGVGVAFCVVFGSVSHFFYDWSGNNALIGFFFPSNESVWEHLKMIFVPFGLYFFVGWFFFKPKSYWASVGLSISVACLTIVTVFYLYTFLFGEDILWIDIALFLLAVCLGFLTFYKLCQHKLALFWQALGYMFLFMWVLLYALCTICAPNTFLFFEPNIAYILKTWGM